MNPINGSWWMVQIVSTSMARQMLAQKKDNFVAPIRNDLNNPPTAVGGI
jgi:hypothetical protein